MDRLICLLCCMHCVFAGKRDWANNHYRAALEQFGKRPMVKISYYSDEYKPDSKFAGLVVYNCDGRWNWKNSIASGGSRVVHNARFAYYIFKDTARWTGEDFRQQGRGLVHDKMYKDVIGGKFSDEKCSVGGFAVMEGQLRTSSIWLNKRVNKDSKTPWYSDGSKHLSTPEAKLAEFAFQQWKDYGTNLKANIPDSLHRSILSPSKDPPKQSCFSGTSVVRTDAGLDIPMGEVKIGDKLQSASPDGRIVYEEVYGFGHREASAQATYIRVEAEEDEDGNVRALELTPAHMLHSGGSCCSFSGLVEAQDLKVGYTIWLTNNDGKMAASRVSNLRTVQSAGAFNPLTRTSSLIVNGISASNFANVPKWLSPAAVHRMWLPYRLVSAFLPTGVTEWLHHSETGAIPCMGGSVCAQVLNSAFGFVLRECG